MNLRYRKLFYRFKPLHQAIRWYMYNKGVFFYKKLYKTRGYESIYASLKDSKKGKRCFIIGNGPSLKVEDLDKLIGEDCLAVNEIHRVFPKTRWRPLICTFADRYSKSTPEEIRDLDCKYVFLGDYYWRYNTVLRKDAVCFHEHMAFSTKEYGFSEDISKCMVIAPTVAYCSMQIAAFMGYSEIFLLGFDHSYSFEFDKKGNIIKTGNESTHFFKDDKAEDIIGNVWGMTKAYESFKRYADEHGIIVKNATRGGKLEIFERVDLDDIV